MKTTGLSTLPLMPDIKQTTLIPCSKIITHKLTVTC